MKVLAFGLFALACALPSGTQAMGTESATDTLWRSHQGGGVPADATSVGLDRRGGPVFVCRGRSEGAWQLGVVRGSACVYYGERRDTIHLSSEVLALPSTAMWKSARGRYRGPDVVDLGIGTGVKGLCRVRKAGRTRVGQTTKRGCQVASREGITRSVATYEVLVDPHARTRQAYQRALTGLTRLVDKLEGLLSDVTVALKGNPGHAELVKLSNRLTPAMASARKSYEQLERSLAAKQRDRLRRLYGIKVEPIFSRMGRARDRLAVAAQVAQTLERCVGLEGDIRRTVDMLTSDTALARRLKARQRISVLTELQARLNRELEGVRRTGNAKLLEDVETLFRPLPSLLSDAIYHLQPWLDAGERNVLYSSYLGGLSLKKPGSASKALRRLLELFRSSDSSVPSAKAVDSFLGLMDDIAATIEQRELPTLPKASATSFRGSDSRTFALNLKRNGFLWLETQLDPDELDSGHTSRYLITPNLDWIVKRLSQKLPSDVVDRVACLRQQMWTGGTFAEQLNHCDEFWVNHPKSSLRTILRDELKTLVEIHSRTLNVRQCKRFKRSVTNPVYKAMATTLCLVDKERLVRAETLRAAFVDVRGLITRGKLRAAQKALKKLRASYPHAALVYQLQYELKRAEQQKAEERLSALKYAGRLQSIERSLPALEEICVKAGREYRRARKRMRLALRRGLDGRAARLRLSHDKAFFRACEARDQVQELLNAQITTGLVQAIRVTKETAPTCLKQWSICDRNP